MRNRGILALALCACGGSSSNVGGVDGGTGNDGGLVTLPDGGTVPTLMCGDENVTSVTGTWDILGSRPGGVQTTAVLTVDANTFSFSIEGKTLAFMAAGPTLLWSDNGKQVAINVGTMPMALDTGLVPLSLGGQWMFSSMTDGESCMASLGTNGFNATCNNVSSTPFGTLNGTVIATRQQTFAAIFGVLGGAWHLSGNGDGTVDAYVSGNTFTAVYQSVNGILGNRDGWVTAKVCNGAAAGLTSDGFEFAATRQ